MIAAKQLSMPSEEEFLVQEEGSEGKHEYVGGYVFAMAEFPIWHNRIATNALGALVAALQGKPCIAFNSDTKVRIKTAGATRFYYPDAMVVCESNDDDQPFQDRPVVVVEVLSDSTRRADHGEKRDAYLTVPSLSAYLLVDTDRPSITVYRRQTEGVGDAAFAAEVYDGLDAVIPLPAAEIELPVEEVYQRVEFGREA